MRVTRTRFAVATAALLMLAGGGTAMSASASPTDASISGKVVVEATSAVVIDKCYLTNQTTQNPATGPTNVATSAFTTTESSLDFKLCWHAYAIPLLDPLHPATASGCATGLPGSLAGGGVSEGSN